ncbi:40S ribosomal protein S3-1, partial [Zea mays]
MVFSYLSSRVVLRAARSVSIGTCQAEAILTCKERLLCVLRRSFTFLCKLRCKCTVPLDTEFLRAFFIFLTHHSLIALSLHSIFLKLYAI